MTLYIMLMYYNYIKKEVCHMKKMLCLCLVLVLITGFSGTSVFAASDISPYERTLNSLNQEFDLNLGYIPVDESKVSLEKYEKTARELAIQQRALIDYISNRENQINKIANPLKDIMPLATVTKTSTKDVWNLTAYFSITATYNVINNSTISSMRNARLNSKNAAIITNTYITGLSGPTYSIIDSGETGTVKYVGTIHFDSIIGISNTVFYTEFYAS